MKNMINKIGNHWLALCLAIFGMMSASPALAGDPTSMADALVIDMGGMDAKIWAAIALAIGFFVCVFGYKMIKKVF